ncbi:MAG: glycosyltransferase family 4 protein [Flavobacteriales bacterium]|nr:glycosyltransferase family 4 protein [Flavobacteriales bacterium]
MKTKVTYILSNIDKAIAFEWIAEHINNAQFEISFILLHHQEPYLYRWLTAQSIATFYVPHNGKKSFPKSFLKVYQLLKAIQPQRVHTHLFDANLIGLTAAKALGIKKRIYTRHHSTFHHNNFPKAVKYDKLSNWLASDIVAISENVRDVLENKEQVPPQKIHLIHHGFDLKSFQNVSKEEVQTLKNNYNINNSPVIGVISRYINWKGIQYIIKGFKALLQEYPDAILVLANANGPDKQEIKEALKTIPKENYREIVFEPNLFALYQLFDLYIHTPIDHQIEAFGQTYIEALAAGKPSIFTLSGVANEFIIDQKNAIVIPYKDDQAIVKAIKQLLTHKDLTSTLVENGLKSVEKYNLLTFVQKLERLYQ